MHATSQQSLSIHAAALGAAPGPVSRGFVNEVPSADRSRCVENTRELIACEDCGLVHRWRPLAADQLACCTRCRHVLYRWHGAEGEARAGTMAVVALAALVIFAVAQCSPILTLDLGGMRSEVSLWQAVGALWTSSNQVVAVLVALCAILFPLLEIGLLLYLACGLARGRRLPGSELALRIAMAARHWAMTDVLMLAILVTLVKLVSRGHVAPHLGLFAFAVLTVLHTWVRQFEARELSLPAGRRNGEDHARSVHVQGRGGCVSTWVLLALAAMLYVPAILLPVMYTRTIAGAEGDTILDGIAHFWRGGSPGLALIVLVTSLVVPVSKLAMLACLNAMAQLHSRRAPGTRMRAYRAVEFIDRWSMLDVFVMTFTVALVRFDGLVVRPGPGALAFCCVVVLTMAASARFDPRLIWSEADAQITAGSRHERMGTKDGMPRRREDVVQ